MQAKARPAKAMAPVPTVEGVRRLAELCQHAGVSELEAGDGEWSLRLMLDPEMAALAVARGETMAAERPAPQPMVLRSQWVGIFHRTLDGQSAPLVQQGQSVREGQVLAVVVALELQHELRADQAGTVLRFLVESGMPVEYGQPLVEIG